MQALTGKPELVETLDRYGYFPLIHMLSNSNLSSLPGPRLWETGRTKRDIPSVALHERVPMQQNLAHLVLGSRQILRRI